MKLTTTILALIASSVVYANNTNIVLNFLNKRELSTTNGNASAIPNECRLAMAEYLECCELPRESNYEETCKIISTDKCQKFYNDPVGTLPSCKSVSAMSEITESMDYTKALLNFYCQKDEAGNYCPVSVFYIKHQNSIMYKIKDYDEAKENTCHSKICSETTVEFAKKFTETVDTGNIKNESDASLMKSSMKDAKELIEYFNSDKCKAMSGASTLKIGSGLFISLALLLLSLY